MNFLPLRRQGNRNCAMTEEQDNPNQPSRDRERLIADAVAAYHDLRLQGEAIDADEYCRDYPELDPELRAQLMALDEIDMALMPSEAPRATQAPELPERLSGYKILGEIGSGGMGRVLLAFDERLGRKVAVKTLSPRYAGNPKLRERFMREARALARLDHPNIVRIYNLGDADEEPHFVMERIEGASLTEAARRLALTQKIDLMLKVVLTVDFLHQRRMIHRDLKPGNILVGPDLEPKVLDFGLAAQVDDLGERLTQTGEDSISIAMMNGDWLKQLSDRNQLDLAHERLDDEMVALTAPTRELRAFALKHADSKEAFCEAEVFHRLRSDK